MSDDSSPAAHLRAARSHIRQATVAVEESRSDVSPSLTRLIAALDRQISLVDDAGVETPRTDNLQTVLDVLDDEGCRRILAVTGTDAYTVSEIRDACDIPRSTVYRKIDRLSETPLLAEDVRIGSRGPHAHEYRRTVDDVLISLGPIPAVTLGTDPLRHGFRPEIGVPSSVATDSGTTARTDAHSPSLTGFRLAPTSLRTVLPNPNGRRASDSNDD